MGFLQGGADDGLEPGAEGGGEAEGLALAQGFGVGEGVAQFLDQHGQRAEAGAAHFAGIGVEGGDGGVDGGEVAFIAGCDGDAAFFPWREVGADVVFLHHQGEGFGRGFGGEDGGAYGGVDRVLGEAVECAGCGEAAEAGDEGVSGVSGVDLDGGAQAVGGDGEAKFGQGGGVEVGAVAGQGFGVDQVGGDAGHARAFAGVGGVRPGRV